MNDMSITTYLLAHYINKLQSDEPFCLVRYGDGEFQAIDVLPHKYNWNCDKHEYTPELKAELEETLKTNEPNFIRAIGNKATQNSGMRLIYEYLKENDCNLHWHDTAFLDASINGEMNPFIQYIRSQKTLYLCSDKLKDFVKRELDVDFVIQIPLLNSYHSIDRIEQEVLDVYHNHDIELILMSGGFLTKALFYRLFVIDKVKANMIDIGSTFDGYVNHRSRSHVKHLTKTAIINNLKRS